MDVMRDRFWLWGHEAGSHNESYGLPAPSRVTPTEAAFYLGIPNLIMVSYHGKPVPPFGQYAAPFRPLKQVVWSIVGAGGVTQEEERSHVFDLASGLPNLTGVMMDDFFNRTTENVGVMSAEDLRQLRSRLAINGRTLDLWVVLYDHQLALPVEDHLAHCDKLSFWTWKAPDLERLEQNFARVEELSPSTSKVLGCYMWDYGQSQSMPLELMARQCDLGLRWLRAGRIDGMIFLASCICDLDLEAVEWTRDWIAAIGDQRL